MILCYTFHVQLLSLVYRSTCELTSRASREPFPIYTQMKRCSCQYHKMPRKSDYHGTSDVDSYRKRIGTLCHPHSHACNRCVTSCLVNACISCTPTCLCMQGRMRLSRTKCVLRQRRDVKKFPNHLPIRLVSCVHCGSYSYICSSYSTYMCDEATLCCFATFWELVVGYLLKELLSTASYSQLYLNEIFMPCL